MNVNDLSVGSMFLDSDGALCIFLGYEKEAASTRIIGDVTVGGQFGHVVDMSAAPRVTYAMFYKNRWSLCDMQALEGPIQMLNMKGAELVQRMSREYVDKHDWCCCEEF